MYVFLFQSMWFFSHLFRYLIIINLFILLSIQANKLFQGHVLLNIQSLMSLIFLITYWDHVRRENYLQAREEVQLLALYLWVAHLQNELTIAKIFRKKQLHLYCVCTHFFSCLLLFPKQYNTKASYTAFTLFYTMVL